ncbi:hypothetical protein GCM10010497_23880 [Streptomyces cinereoruber]|uniref:Uncharacterized protein n=1 Tax=Streptomyces cinereoruber TaxID=67260 RepID=A0AAV4KKD8_9ACTN|nr:hypothetical protein [Streptomyces cinereoruber]NIH63961.1 hypothetical protein [Streptomyces cinereoruber]GGR20775.1 hypothetical protein GCM10010497_23880 [Streptomyces cinereoruber]
MEDFFAKVGRFWPAGRRDLHWHILPTPTEADALIAPYRGVGSQIPCHFLSRDVM